MTTAKIENILQQQIDQLIPYTTIECTHVYINDDGNIIVQAEPSLQHPPRCIGCGTEGERIVGNATREIRDLPVYGRDVIINSTIKRIDCPKCEQVKVQDLKFVRKGRKTTNRLARYVGELSDIKSKNHIAKHMDFSWPTVDQMVKDKEQLERMEYDNNDVIAFDVLEYSQAAVRMVALHYDTGDIFADKYVKKEQKKKFIEAMLKSWKNSLGDAFHRLTFTSISDSEQVKQGLPE